MFSKRAIPFTPLPASFSQMTWADLTVRAILLGCIVGWLLSPFVMMAYIFFM